MRVRGRTDANHKAIVQALRRAGCYVLDLSRVGGGCPDLLVSCARWGGLPTLIEVKTARGTLTADQRAFMAVGWRVVIVRTVDEALRLVGVPLAREPPRVAGGGS